MTTSTPETQPVLTIGDKQYNLSDLSPDAISVVNALSRAAGMAQELQADLTVNLAGQQSLMATLQTLLPKANEQSSSSKTEEEEIAEDLRGIDSKND